MMRQLQNIPFSTYIGQGYCADDQGLTAFSKFSCTFCEASASTTSCSSACWDLQENHLNPLLADFHDRSGYTNIIINTVGYQFTDNIRCECLLDTDFLDADEATTLELTNRLFDLAESTGYAFIAQGFEFERFTNMGPIASSVGDGASCYAFGDEGTPSSSCSDQVGYFDKDGDDCGWYSNNGCFSCDSYANSDGVSACQACCVCGGGTQIYPEGAPTPAPTEYQPTLWSSYNDDSESSGDAFVFVGIFVWILAFSCVTVFFVLRQKARQEEAVANETAHPQPSAPIEGSSNNGNAVLTRPQQQQEVFAARLAATSMIVAKEDFVAKDPTVRKLDFDDDQVSGTAATESEEDEDIVVPPMFDIELGDDDNGNDATLPAFEESMRTDSEFNRWMLRLPKNNNKRNNHKVPCQCAICLSSYKVGDCVSWAAAAPSSTESKCQHAFHTSCIVKYAETSTSNSDSMGVACPMCRQPFVST